MNKFAHRNWIVALLFLLIAASCDEKDNVPKPDHLIEESEMVAVLADICKVEARFQRRLTISNITVTEMVKHNYTLVLDKHDISLIQFKNSYQYYEENPSKMQQIYDSVIVHLTKEQVLLNEKDKDNTKKKADKTKINEPI